MTDAIETVRDWVDESTRIVSLTGAGISTESGIPDFRGPQGVLTRTPKAERLSNIHYYMSDPRSIHYYMSDPRSVGSRGRAGSIIQRGTPSRMPATTHSSRSNGMERRSKAPTIRCTTSPLSPSRRPQGPGLRAQSRASSPEF